MFWSFLLPTIFALYAYFKKKVTVSGIIFAWICGFLITFIGGLYAFSALALAFVLTIFTDKIKKSSNDKTRDIWQIICNILIPTICMVVYFFTDYFAYYAFYYAILAGSLADTFASSIGSFSKKEPINIITMQKQEKGLSGGVTFLGFIASLIGGILIGLVFYLETRLSYYLLLISVLGFMGSLADSVLGVLFQAKYKCPKCKKIVDDVVHCKKDTKLIAGYAHINNNMINLISNIVMLIICYLVFP